MAGRYAAKPFFQMPILKTLFKDWSAQKISQKFLSKKLKKYASIQVPAKYI